MPAAVGRPAATEEVAEVMGGEVDRRERLVLIVDDEAATRVLLRQTLQGLPFPCRIYEAANGDEALKVTHEIRPDLALVDIMLPASSVSGVVLCQQMCRDSRTKVAIISGHATETIVQACLTAGAVGYVRKPFSVEEMRDRVTGWLSE